MSLFARINDSYQKQLQDQIASINCGLQKNMSFLFPLQERFINDVEKYYKKRKFNVIINSNRSGVRISYGVNTRLAKRAYTVRIKNNSMQGFKDIKTDSLISFIYYLAIYDWISYNVMKLTSKCRTT